LLREGKITLTTRGRRKKEKTCPKRGRKGGSALQIGKLEDGHCEEKRKEM